jgi:ABC-2 type transport system permease protein
MSDFGLTIRELRFENKIFWRNPPAVFFTFAFPLMFLFIFSLFDGPGGDSTFFIPVIVAFSVITACYTNTAITVCFQRDEGVLKRIRGTPLPPKIYLAGRVLHSIAVALMLVAITLLVGRVVYDVDIPTTTMPAFVVSLVVAAAAFSALALAVTAAVPNAEASPAVVNGTILPLLFVSDVFIPLEDPPRWLDVTTNVFPVRHLSEVMQVAFHPSTIGSGFRPGHLLIITAWGIAGLVLAVRFFRWEPRY